MNNPHSRIATQASLKSLTITECGSTVGEMEFAAFGACQHLIFLAVETESQIHPACVSSISALTRLNNLQLTVEPGERKSAANVTQYKGCPEGLLQLSALTSLKLSGWTFINSIPPPSANWSNISKLEVVNCAVMMLAPALQQLQTMHTLDLSLNCLGQ